MKVLHLVMVAIYDGCQCQIILQVDQPNIFSAAVSEDTILMRLYFSFMHNV